jgi:hypothetical protein
MAVPVPILIVLGKLAQQGVAVGGKAFSYYTTAARLSDLPTVEAAVCDLEQMTQAMSDAERMGFSMVVAALARGERQLARRERYAALLRTFPWGEAMLKVTGAAAQPQQLQPGAAVSAPQPLNAASPHQPLNAAPVPQPLKVNKFEKYTHRAYDFTFPDMRRPVISIWEAGSTDIARMRRIDLAESLADRWVTLRDWQNREVPARARRDGADIWLLKL